MSFKDEIRLDIATLDEAALQQPTLYAENGELWAQAILDRDRAKERLSAKRTEVDESVRNDPEKYGLTPGGKPTETWIANKIAQHEDVIALTEELNSAQYNVNMMTVGKETLDHRMKALDILTKLYQGNYFSAQSKSSQVFNNAMNKSEEKQRAEIEASPRMQEVIKKTILRRAKNGTDS